VSVVTFGQTVTVVGDTRKFPIESHKYNDMQKLIDNGKEVSSKCRAPIGTNADNLWSNVANLTTSGCTALGPALSVALGLAHDKPGAAIVLATDGASNTGIGSGKDAKFYQSAALHAKQKNITCSVLTLEGEDCGAHTVFVGARVR
jgi:hypothetical protein